MRIARIWIYIGIVILVLSATRVITGADDITSIGTLRAALVASIPIAMAGLGGLWAERSGVVNIGLEGMMIMGTLGAGYFAYHHGVVAGIVFAALLGAAAGVIHAVATVVFGVDHIVSGVAINFMAAGMAAFLAEALFSSLPGGGPTQSPGLPKPSRITIPGISDGAADLQDKGWFLISDLAGLVGALTTQLSVVTILALVLLVGSAWLLWHTPFGLRLRSCGENPQAAETLGVNVYLFKFIAVTASGAFAGLGGAYLAMVASSGYSNGQTLGLGYIGLAAMIFGNWRPSGMFIGALLFGYTLAARLRSGGESVHAILLIAAVALLALAAYQAYKRGWIGAALSAVMGAGALWWYLAIDEVPQDFTEMTPYVATLLVLSFASQSLRMPAADGQIYRRGTAG